MKIKFYLYNTFTIEWGNKKILIDPGANLYRLKFKSLIPKEDWADFTHIFVTHGDPDHHWYTDKIANASNAEVVCNKTMFRNVDGKELMLGPRDKGLAFTTAIQNVHTLSVDETIEVDGMRITGIKATHGPLTIKLGPFHKTLEPGPTERIGHGAIGFKIEVDGYTIVNLGDTLLHEKEWEYIKHPDVLMIPIGGKHAHNTMDEEEALKAVKVIQPKLVIPCHYNCPAFTEKNYNPADDLYFKTEVEQMGFQCEILKKWQHTDIVKQEEYAYTD